MKICILGINNKHHAPQRVYEEAKKRGHKAIFANWKELEFFIENKKFEINFRGEDLANSDAIFSRNVKHVYSSKTIDNRYLLGVLRSFCEKKGIYFFNNKFQLLNKLQQQAFFIDKNFDTLDTYYTKNIALLKKNIKKFPLIAKPLEGSAGRGILKINEMDDLDKLFDLEYKNTEYIFQKYYKIKSDLRILILNGEILGVMKRKLISNNCITNYSGGGEVSKGDCSKKTKQMALKVVKEMNLSYAGVDVLTDEDGNSRIIEVNEFPQFKGFESIFSKVNVASEIVDFIEKQVNLK